MGHSSIAITFDTYGHLFDGSEAKAAELVDAYPKLSRSGPRSKRAALRMWTS